MTTDVLRAPQTIGTGARQLLYIALGLVAIALVLAALVSGGGSSTTSGSAVSSGRAVSLSHPDEAITAGAISKPQDNAVPRGSGIRFGRAPNNVPAPNLLPK